MSSSVTYHCSMLEKAKQKAKGAISRSAARGGHRIDDRAQSTGASGAVNLVVALVVGGLMAAFLLPIAIDEIVAVDTSSWSNGAGSLWEILPVMVVLAVFLFFVKIALDKSGRM